MARKFCADIARPVACGRYKIGNNYNYAVRLGNRNLLLGHTLTLIVQRATYNIAEIRRFRRIPSWMLRPLVRPARTTIMNGRFLFRPVEPRSDAFRISRRMQWDHRSLAALICSFNGSTKLTKQLAALRYLLVQI